MATDRDTINIGLLGLGVVGSGVAAALRGKADMLAEQAGVSLSLQKVLVRDVSRPRPGEIKAGLLTDDVRKVIADPAIDVIIELMGGEHPALEYIKEAIMRGKHVVTANKEVMAKHGYKLLSLAKEYNVQLRYEASVGGGIPLIVPFEQSLLANDISAIYAILNGTTNYILTRMSRDGLDFAVALRRAQELGYAEAEPVNDIEGMDAAYKLAILAGLAFHVRVNPQDIYCEGISHLEARDFCYAKEFGYAIKLLAIAKQAEGALDIRVHPVFIPEDAQLAKVDGVYNAVQVEGDLVGRVIFYGEGAGASPTASAVVADVLAEAKNICCQEKEFSQRLVIRDLVMKPVTEIEACYYLRLSAADCAGVLAQISRVLGDNAISIASVVQKESDPATKSAEIVVMTHPAREKALRKAIEELECLDVVRKISNFIRVEA